MKKLMWLWLALLLVLVIGCNDTIQKEVKLINDGVDVEIKKIALERREPFDACIANGGVPIQAWFNDSILGDCKFPPNSN